MNAVPAPIRVCLDETYLAAFGEFLIPEHVWRAMQRFSIWIEPAVVAEWARLMQRYAAGQGRDIPDVQITTAMTWMEPTRDVRIARERAVQLLEPGLHCVWSGKRLSDRSLDIDHCLPWSAWACGDLWNLLPSHRDVNQRQKRERLPSAAVMAVAEDRILSWWDAAYGRASPVVAERFLLEAKASLPGLSERTPNVGDVFGAACLQRLRLKLDQQVPEWDGPRCVG